MAADTSAPIKRNSLKTSIGSVPFDVLLEILNELGPFELLRLSRTNKDLRQILTERRSAPIWRHALCKMDDAPRCPDDMTEMQWAVLLYGDPECQECSAGEIADTSNKPATASHLRSLHRCTVDFILQQRLCQRCWESKLVLPNEFDEYDQVFQTSRALVGREEDSLEDLASYTRLGKPKGKKYYRQDLIDTTNVCRNFVNFLSAHPGHREVRKMLKKYVKSRKNIVMLSSRPVAYCGRWASREAKLEQIEAKGAEKDRIRLAREKLIEDLERQMSGIYKCPNCRKKPFIRIEALLSHMRDVHGVTNPLEGLVKVSRWERAFLNQSSRME